MVQAFINSHYDLECAHGSDLFATPEALAAWLERRGLGRALLSANDVGRAVAVREGLRSLARGNASAAPPDLSALSELNRAASGAALEVRFSEDGAPRFVASDGEPLDRALAVVLGAAARAMIASSWAQLKVCPGEDCGWAFYDHSRNQSGRWCSMAVCGGRAKARAHYRRRRQGGD